MTLNFCACCGYPSNHLNEVKNIHNIAQSLCDFCSQSPFVLEAWIHLSADLKIMQNQSYQMNILLEKLK